MGSKLYCSLMPRKLLKTRRHYCQLRQICREPLHPIAPGGAGSESRRQRTATTAAGEFVGRHAGKRHFDSHSNLKTLEHRVAARTRTNIALGDEANSG
jgi:hypothetical protein